MDKQSDEKLRQLQALLAGSDQPEQDLRFTLDFLCALLDGRAGPPG